LCHFHSILQHSLSLCPIDARGRRLCSTTTTTTTTPCTLRISTRHKLFPLFFSYGPAYRN
jgi:hypothetical protein